MKKVCLNCGKELTNKQTKYCSNQCQADYQRKEYIERWKQGLENGCRGEFELSKHIKRYLLEQNNYKCEKCGWGEINPYTNTLPLEIHHKDGEHTNNKEENLEVLCPNCHSLTENYKAANKNSTRKNREKHYEKKEYFCIECGKQITSHSSSGLCVECSNKKARKCERPSREELKILIRALPFTTIANKYSVSDNSIRKWCKAENLPYTKTEINKISDKDWESI